MTLSVTKAAWTHPPTRAGYQNLVRRRAVWLAVFSASTFVTLMVPLIHSSERSQYLAFVATVLLNGPMLLLMALLYVRRIRILAVLRAYPWQDRQCEYSSRADSSTDATLIRIGFDASYTPQFRLFPYPLDLARKENAHPDRVWFAGDPRYGGVVSPVGGHYPVRVVPHRMPEGRWSGGGGNGDEPDALAVRVGLVRRRSGKGTQT
ncbi:hypothetical protein [Streptomyces sp. NPDC048603]|uniref:hypothetical protein n=1 Tax=Streptomyces sp. NPDC048603 TaxID=3365577 RepID=UPI00371BDE54